MQDDFTREAIGAMPREEVAELLAAHGIEGVQGPLDDLRARLVAVMFVDI